MFQIAVRGLRQNPFRYLATAAAIVLGIAFYVATAVMTTSFQDTLDQTVAAAFDDVDGAVRSTQVVEAGLVETRRRIPYETEEQVAAIDGVAGAAAYLSGYAQVVTADGDIVDSAARHRRPSPGSPTAPSTPTGSSTAELRRALARSCSTSAPSPTAGS